MCPDGRFKPLSGDFTQRISPTTIAQTDSCLNLKAMEDKEEPKKEPTKSPEVVNYHIYLNKDCDAPEEKPAEPKEDTKKAKETVVKK